MASTPANPITSAWSQGQAAVGVDVHGAPQQFARPVVFQQGIATGVIGASPPLVTAPGTVASGGTVTNSTGFDCMAYMSSTTGISSVVFVGVAAGTIAAGAGGTVPALQAFPVYVPNNSKIAVSYTGTLSWTWLAV